LVIAACSSDGAAAGLRFEDAWARPGPGVATTAAFYLAIENRSAVDERLVAAASDACRVAELHESSMTDGVMGMQQLLEGIPVPAGTTVILQPGGLHIMCIDKTVDFTPGTEIELSLDFVDGDGTMHSETVAALVDDR
jgi:copper(I)-binding protein